ncbi:MAG: hypothetical protein ACFCU6_10560 [Balneolaceae bacterium]
MTVTGTGFYFDFNKYPKWYCCAVILLQIVFFVVISKPALAQVSPQFYDFPHNHLSWFTIESDHFLVHYQEGNNRSAQIASRIAEEVYEPITSLYSYKPKNKISIVLRDREDFSNGAAFFFDNKMEIWVPSLDTPLRGTHNWFRNVIAHEFTHMVQLGASMRRSSNIPAIYFQWLSYEKVRRPDVQFGFPNGVVTMPFATVSIPGWFAEGTAQYQRAGMMYDYWDSHRDMILRTSILDDDYLNFVEMSTFSSKTSTEREDVYNQGFNFVIYLVDRFGEQVIADITHAAANGKKHNFNKVMETATGIRGEQLFDDWISEKREFYRNAIEGIRFTESTVEENTGFFNFYPIFSADGKYFAYLSNLDRDFGRTALILKDRQGLVKTLDTTGETPALDNQQQYLFQHGLKSNATLDFISNRFSFSPDGTSLLFNIARKNNLGETYQDLYIYNIESEKREKLTDSKRIQDPVWDSKGNLIAAVQRRDGTENLILYNKENQEIKTLTDFKSGETVYTPVWGKNDSSLYFATAFTGNRNIFKFDIETGEIITVFEDPLIDYRDPWIDMENNILYYSSDPDGIFNIYSLDLHTGDQKQLTSVIGGAFMPHANNGRLYFSEYKTEGYKITSIPLTPFEPQQYGAYNPKPMNHADPTDIPEYILALNSFDDSDIEPIQEPISKGPQAEEIEFQIPTKNQSDDRILKPYSETITGFNIFPLVRFDNYTKLNGSNSSLVKAAQFGDLAENLWRDAKIGMFFTTRDVTEKLDIFGGALFGFGSLPTDGVGDFFSPSRLNKLDRDLFLTIQHRGFPFIETSWSPTISVELFNITRNVRDGLSIDEIPCTSCLPETSFSDIRFILWEANLFLRSKLNRWSLLEFGIGISPFSVATDGFFSRELQQFIPGSNNEFFRGTTLSAAYYYELIMPTRHADIAPQGFKGNVTYRYQPSRLLENFEVEDGQLSPVFKRDLNHSIEFRNRYGFSLSNNETAMITTRAFAYLNDPDDFFFLDYTGGLTGMRSYPFFAVGGNRTAFTRLSYLRPVYQSLNTQMGRYSLDKLFAHLFLEAGNGWGGQLNIGNNIKYGIGGELRFAFNNSYLFPMKLFINGTYGFNRFDVELSDDFITGSGSNRVQFGREFLFYFGLTFDFDFL